MEFYRSHILVCSGTGCHASGSLLLKAALESELARTGLDKEVKVIETGCFGFCRFGPNMMVYPEGVFYCGVQEEDVAELVEEHIVKGRVVDRLLYREPTTEKPVVDFQDIPFFKKQTRVVLENCGIINPESIKEYIARDGYFGLAKALRMKPEEVVDMVKKSGLRGRGGAGFPTGLKWEFTAKATGSPKYVVCNADEGDPGAFMDRSTIEGDPHRLVEGMTIAGYAVGASHGYIYCRAEYPLAVERLYKAIAQAREYGLLGKNILGSGFDFDLDVRLGAGAFVCGEETALLNSVMGRRGEPRPRPPFPATSGLWNKPTVLNNVETFANIPTIMRKGWEWFASMGTEKSKGTKVFALAGKINNNGLAEIPMGTTIGEIVYDIGGGIPKGKKFKAVQTGGPSGGCIPVEYLNTPVDYETLAALGTIMGSGGFIVMDEDTCMVDLAKFFLEFVQSESCGKCTPCRIGTKRMLEILQRITRGQGKEGDIDELLQLGETICQTSLCGLGQTAPNPVISTIKYFRHEYEAHIRDKRCDASVCAALFNAPCQNTCPAHVDVPIYIDLIRQGQFQAAYEEVFRENPFPVVCGRVCNHPCESRCRRAQLDEPVAIRELKRFASDWAMGPDGANPKVTVAPPTGKKVAIIGSGPAGLTAATYLTMKGHSVTVFEALPQPGGMLQYGIPEYRLPKSSLKKDIDVIKGLGVEIRTGVRVGTDVSFDTLRSEYDAIFVAIGAHKDQKLGIPGEDLHGVIPGAQFLRDINMGKKVDLRGKKVVVVGAGNVAMDAARSARRLGAESVTVVYRRRREDMPAAEEEIKAAEEEGIVFSLMVNPKALKGEDGVLKAVTCVSMKAGAFDNSGRRRTEPIEGSDFDLPCDVLIPAIGQVPETEPFENTDLPIERRTFKVDPRTMATGIAGVFAGGDCQTGPATVVEAIGAGKKAAAAIDAYLGGDGDVVPKLDIARKLSAPVVEEKMKRSHGKTASMVSRLNSFAEVELGYDARTAQREASRCLRCDVKE